MQNVPLTLLAIATMAAALSPALSAQAQSQATQSQPAPIVRSAPSQSFSQSSQSQNQYGNTTPGYTNPGTAPATPQITNAEPITGVLLRTEPGTSFQTIAADAQGAQLRLDHGRANISVHHPAPKSEILVDLPGGQVSLLKDGLYTFNADTNTVRVLKGEAAAFTPGDNSTKGTKIKEEQQLSFTSNDPRGLRAVDAPRNQLAADLFPTDGSRNGDGYGDGGYGYRGYGYAPYGYGYPYSAFGYPYGYGYPYGIGLGFGYYGGFRGGFGGYRGGFGGYRGGFGGRGGGFRR